LEISLKDISTPVHAHAELEFSFLNLLLKDAQGQLIYGSRSSKETHSFDELEFLTNLDLLSMTAWLWPKQLVLIPNETYDPSISSDTYLSQIYQSTNNLLIKSERISFLNSTLIYGIEPTHQLTAIKAHTGVRTKCALTPIIQYVLDISQENNIVLCHVLEHTLWLLVKINNVLSVCNHYNIDKNEDILYYLSLMLKHYPSAQEKIVISGISNTTLLNLLRQYYTVENLDQQTALYGSFILTNSLLNENN